MSEKAATPKTTRPARAKTGLTVRKAAPRKTPGKAHAVTATTHAEPVSAKPALDTAIVHGPEKKSKKTGKAGAKIKVVRDSFTMPQSDYARIGELKRLCRKTGLHVKKSELLRAGLHALGELNIAQLTESLSRLEKIKTGRPKKS